MGARRPGKGVSDEQSGVVRIAVVADTHVPDRAVDLHPALIPHLQAAGVQRILHAGDVCSPVVLEQLREVAPVTAVRGNRDWLFGNRNLSMSETIQIGQISIILLHGHFGFLPYFRDKWYYLTQGYRLERYLRAFRAIEPSAKVLVFGHTHRPVNLWEHGRLIFNPGSASVIPYEGANPTYGVLQIAGDGSVQGDVIELTGARLENRRWMPIR